MPSPSRNPVKPTTAPAPAPWPLARSVSLAMLAFSLAAVALLAYMNLALISQPVQDRFTNPKNTHTQRDPFRLSGCIDLSTAASAPCDTAQAEQFALAWPPHADYLASSLHQYVAPRRGHSPNQQMLQANPGLPTPITQGRNLTLGIDIKMQELAQITAACFASGDAAACQRCHWCDARKAPAMYEQARARAMGILVVNAKTGAVQAAASAYTPCFAAQQRGELPAAACPVLPNTRVPHLDRLGSQALEQTAKPGSITKLPIALGLLRAGLSADEAAQLPRILSQSLTPELIDIVMCRAQNFDPSCARKRLSAVADAARELGWQGQADVLGAGQLPGLSAQRFTGRMLQPVGNATPPTTPQSAKLSREALQACANKPKAQRWRNCSGADLVNLLAELFGTGDALASPVGVANAFLHLSAAANAAPRAAQAHLVVAAQNDAGQHHAVQALLAPQPSAAHARQVLQGMALATTEGTARTACDAAAKAWPGGLLPCAAQDKTTGLRSGLRIAGKTGTPVMSSDAGEHTSKTLPQWLAQCTTLRSELGRTPKTTTRWYYLNNESGKCNATGVKWYAFLVSAPGSTTWDHVVVVLAERNWSQKTQLIDSPNDRGGPNVAAEAGLSLANALYRP